MSGAWILPVVVFLPLAGALAVVLVPQKEEKLLRGLGLVASLSTFLVSLLLWRAFDPGQAGFQLVIDRPWIPGLEAHFKLGVDGISLWLVLLTTFLTPVAMLSSHRAITRRVRGFVVAFLLLETGMLGAFLALDLFLFYVMWEAMLVPMYFVIGVWGGERRIYASIKFVLYTMVGSLLMLVAIFYLHAQYGVASGGQHSFDVERLWNLQLPHNAQLWAFLAFALAFAIKVPLFPLHTWLPDAHVEAPTAGSVILAAVLLKFGVYGFLRYAMPLFPWASQQAAPYLALLAVVGIVYGALVAFAQEDVKKLVAYSSVSHLGFCVLGAFAVNANGLQGSLFAALSHGLTTGGLFLAVGVLYERRHTRKIAELGGLGAPMPVFAAMFMVIMLGSLGLPGLSGFIGEFLTLIGAFVARPDVLRHGQGLAIAGASGVVLSAVYLLYVYQRVVFGPVTDERNRALPDLCLREVAVFAPVIVGVLVLGLYPRPFLAAMEPAVMRLEQAYLAKRDAPDRLHLLVPGIETRPVGPGTAVWPALGATRARVDAAGAPQSEMALAPREAPGVQP